MLLPFLSVLRPDHAALLRALQEKLARLPLLSDISDTTLWRVVAESAWFGLPGGLRLEREEDAALFLVVTGALGVFAESEGGERRLLVQVSPGEMVGEINLLTGENAPDLVALRDTEILKISQAGFEILAARHPRVMFEMMKTIARRLTETSRESRARTRPKTLALVPLQEGLRDDPIAQRLAVALVEMGAKAGVLDASAATETADWFNAFEAAHDVVFYRGDDPDSAWTQHCMRQADRILLIARSDRPLPQKPLRGMKESVCGLPELLVLHAGSSRPGLPEHFSLRSGFFESHHHIRQNRPDDIRRLARCVSGRAVGLVLSGGAARGFAHIGVVKALTEAGVPFDYLGGVSMGAIVAAGLAAEWSIDELTEHMREAFVAANPLSDYTLPLIALVKGRKMTKLLSTHFGKMRIEHLPKPFFCISSDLTTGHVHEHRNGPLWRALRSSAALPGIVPPVTSRGHLLVDGGVMNNLPVDFMRKRRIGPLIASDVTGEIDFSVRDSRYGERTVWRLLWQRMRGMPSIFDILMRTGTMGSEAQRKLVRDEADFLFEPPLAGLNPLDWKSFDRAIAEGYAHAVTAIEKQGVPLTDIWSEGPAVVMSKTYFSRI